MLFAVGTYTSFGGPGVAVIDAKKDKIECVASLAAVADPTWVMQSPGKANILYSSGAITGTKTGLVASYLWAEGRLMVLSVQETGGRACCHLCVDADESHLYAANYLDGSVSVFPLKDGKIGPCCQFLPYTAPLGPNEKRQESSHAHQFSFRPGTREAYVCNLGTDQVVVYERQEDGTLAFRYAIPCQAGTGSRHLIFDGPNRFYLAGELTGWVSTFTFQGGQWHCDQVLSTLPEGGFQGTNTAAAIRMDESKIYVSNRGHDSIALFDRLPEGTLRSAGHLASPGCFPRDFQLWEGGFLIAQQKAGGVVFMDREGKAHGQVDIPGAVCVCPMAE